METTLGYEAVYITFTQTQVRIFSLRKPNVEKLYSVPDPPKLPRVLLKKLRDGQYFCPIDGVTAGSPLSPIPASIFKFIFEKKCIGHER